MTDSHSGVSSDFGLYPFHKEPRNSKASLSVVLENQPEATTSIQQHSNPPHHNQEKSRVNYCKRLGSQVRQVVNWLPIVFVLGILIYSYYVYVIEYNFLTLLQYDPPQVVKAVLYLIFYNLLVAMLLVNFIITVFRHPGCPGNYRIQIVPEDTPQGWTVDINGLAIFNQHNDRYCGICNTPKPERCHHCSECGRCVLKMDHHCPWFNNCIGYRNYKFFFHSLFYGFCTCVFVFATLLQELIWELSNNATKASSIQFLIIDVFSGIMASGIMTLLFYHAYLVGRNRTTIEQLDRADALRAPTVKNFNLGVWRNLQQVFGNNPLIWFLPIFHDGASQGLLFPHSSEPASSNQRPNSPTISWVKGNSTSSNTVVNNNSKMIDV